MRVKIEVIKKYEVKYGVKYKIVLKVQVVQIIL